MIKNSVVALVSAAALAGVAIPVMAAPAPAPAAEETTNDFNADYVEYQLAAQGVNVQRVEQWGSYVRAFVTGADGRVTMQFFHADTLTPANI